MPSSWSTKPAGTCPRASSCRPISPSFCCRRSAQSSTRSRTSGSSCATTGSPTASSNPTTISSTIVVRHGTSSSTSLGASCPLDCANGPTGSDQWDLVLDDALPPGATIADLNQFLVGATRVEIEEDSDITDENNETGGLPSKQADILVSLAADAELFHAPDNTNFADIDINGHRETWAVRRSGFRGWLTRRDYEETGGAPNSNALESALRVIEAKAQFDAPERAVHTRGGGLDGRLYLD